MRFLTTISMLLLLLINAPISHANFAAWDAPQKGKASVEWQVKESEHFAITFPKTNVAMANKALNIAERIHRELVPFFGKPPQEKTQMVLVDDFDFSNGWATFFPYAQIRLFSSPPDTISGLEASDDWLHSLIRHEYVHILQLQMARGLPKAVKNIFGNIVLAFPHSMTPSFMLEGLATYLETNHELGYGRLQSSYYRMQMRTEVAENRLKTLGEVSVPLRDWPLGMQYLYGSYFYQFLAEVYGEKSIKKYLTSYSGEGIPAVMQNYVMDSIVGKDFDQLWQEYLQWLKEEFSTEIEVLATSAEQGEPLPIEKGRQGLFKDVSNSMKDGYYFIDNNGEDTPVLTVYRNGEFSKLVKTKGVLALDVNEQQAVAASRMVVWKDGRSWADVYLMVDGIAGKEWKAITTKARLRNVRWLNNNLMIASRKINGTSEFVLLNKQGKMVTLWRGEDETTVLGDYDISAQGDYIVASVKRPNQGWNLERIKLNQKLSLTSLKIISWQPITDTKAVENSPQILANGNIIYSADYDGVYNLFLLDAHSTASTVTQLTHMLTGAFEPKVVYSKNSSATSKIIFQAYTADGFQQRSIALNSESLTSLKSFPLQQEQGRFNYPKPYSIDVEKTLAEPYKPWQSLVPRWWFPYFNATEEASQIGFSTGGRDVLARHNYALQFAIDRENELADGSIAYNYDNRYQAVFQRTHKYINTVNDRKPEFIIEQDRWLFARNHLANALEDQLSVNAAITIKREGTIAREDLGKLTCIDAIRQRHKTCEKTLAGIGMKYDSRENYLNTAGFSSGRYFDLVFETNDLLTGVLDSDYKGGILQGQWQEIFDMPGRSSFSFQILAARTDKDNEAITIGGENRLIESSLFGRDDFALRGYAPSVQRGNMMNVNRLNINQWLGRIDEGWGIWPIGIGDYSADFYLDYGGAWQNGETANYLTGVGIDFNIEILAVYNFLIPIRFSLAHGLDKKVGEDRASIGISLPY